MLHKSESLEKQNREDTRHNVENDPAKKGKDKRIDDTDQSRRLAGSWRKRVHLCPGKGKRIRERAVRQILCENQKPGDRLNVTCLITSRQGEAKPFIRYNEILLRNMFY